MSSLESEPSHQYLMYSSVCGSKFGASIVGTMVGTGEYFVSFAETLPIKNKETHIKRIMILCAYVIFNCLHSANFNHLPVIN